MARRETPLSINEYSITDAFALLMKSTPFPYTLVSYDVTSLLSALKWDDQHPGQQSFHWWLVQQNPWP